MRKSLLCALRKFQPRDGHDPLENFITEAFAWLLNNHQGFGKFYLSKIRDRMGLEGEVSGLIGEWNTRLPLHGYYPDLMCTVGITAYLFEHKAWNHLHADQLVNYRRAAEQRFGIGNYHLILVVGGRQLFGQNPDLALCWHEIHAWISEWLDHKDYEPEPLFKDFQSLLESEGMGPPAPISHESILAYKPARTLEPSLSNLVQRAIHHNWKECFPVTAPDPKLPWHRGLWNGQDPWGRIGINFAGDVENWTPECFAGFILDPKDHMITWLEPDCPDFSIILGANVQKCPDYYRSPQWVALVEALRVEVRTRCPEFDFLDHLASCDTPNFWHPIHIRMPMTELFRGTKTGDEQYERFIDHCARVLSCIDRLPEFSSFRRFLGSSTPASMAAS